MASDGESIGSQLFREKLKDTKQVALAERIGIKQPRLSDFATGRRKPTRSEAVTLQKELSIPVESWDEPVEEAGAA